MRLAAFVATFFALVVTAGASDDFVCKDPQVIAPTTTGPNGEVKVEFLRCSNEDELRSPRNNIRIARQSAPANVCGNTCNTSCFAGQVGTGPNPNDCQIIADALLYDSQNVAALFTTNPANGTAVLTMQYSTCKAFFVDQAGVPLQYCRTDFSTLVNFLAFNCQAQQNAHGGNCVASDQRWFVQVQHV